MTIDGSVSDTRSISNSHNGQWRLTCLFDQLDSGVEDASPRLLLVLLAN